MNDIKYKIAKFNSNKMYGPLNAWFTIRVGLSVKALQIFSQQLFLVFTLQGEKKKVFSTKHAFLSFCKKKVYLYIFKCLYEANYEDWTIQTFEVRRAQHVPSSIYKYTWVSKFRHSQVQKPIISKYLINIMSWERYLDEYFSV